VRDPSLLMSSRALPAPEQSGGDGASVVADCMQVDSLSLLVVGEARGGQQDARAALRIAFDQVRAHVSRNADLIERLALNPTDSLRQRVEGRLRDGFVQASREVHALSLRRDQPIAVDLDAVVALPAELFVAHAGKGAVILHHAGLVHRLTVSGGAERPLPRSLDEDLASMAPAGPQATQPLGQTSEPPPVETVAIDLGPGDRVVLLAASLAEGLGGEQLATALRVEGLGAVIEELQAIAAVDVTRPRVAAAVQRGADAPSPGSGRERIATLRRIELFRWCSDAELVRMAELALPRSFPRGSLLLRQGVTNTTLYLLVSGRVGVNKDGQRIAEVDSGTVFGEMSMLDDPRASATVEALTPVEVLTLDRDSFLAALKADANMAVKVLWSLLLRVSGNLRKTSERLADASAAGLAGSTDDETIEDAATVQADAIAVQVEESEEVL